MIMNRPCASRTDASLLYWFENRPASINPPTSTDGCLVIFRFHIYSTNPTSQRCGFGSDTTSTAGGGRNDAEGGVFLRLISKVWSESLLYLFCWITLICCRFYLLQMSGMQSKTNSYDGGEAWSQLTSLSCGGYDLRMHARWHVFFFPPLSASILINLIESITFWQFLHRVFAYRIVDEVSQITLLGFLAWTVKYFRINLCMLEVVIDFLSRKSFIFCYSTSSKSTFFFFYHHHSSQKSYGVWRWPWYFNSFDVFQMSTLIFFFLMVWARGGCA